MEEEMETLRILDENDNELTEEQADTELGYLYPDSIVKEHHNEVKAVTEVGHYYPETFYFENGDPYTVQGEEEDADPHVGKTDKEGVFTFIAQTPEEASLQVRALTSSGSSTHPPLSTRPRMMTMRKSSVITGIPKRNLPSARR